MSPPEPRIEPEAGEPARSRPAVRRIAVVWVALLLLLGITVAAAQVRLGGWNLAVSLGIALLKTVLVGWVYMALDEAPRLQRVVVAAALFALGVLLSLATVDFGTRRDAPAAWQVPHGVGAVLEQVHPDVPPRR